MGKPSEQSFYNRLNALAGTNKKSNINENTGHGTLIDFQKSNEGTVYGIVKENHRYFIKKSNTQNTQLDASDFAYIGGLENKHLYEYHSLGEAEKQRNIYIKSLNEAFSLRPTEIIKEEKKVETVDDPFSFLRNQINEGKTVNKKKFEQKFKSSLKETVEISEKKRGLMPEAADFAVKKALGLISEEKAISTEDSEVKDGDILPDKKGKEKPQAPINDSNAQKIANKAMGHDKEDYPKVPKGDGVLAVNQNGKPLKEEVSPLVTADSEENPADSLVNDVNQKHEKPQAPINDSNAKAIADKATGGQGAAPIQNDVEESPESDPFDDKEDDGEKEGDISVNIAEGQKAVSTEDSDQKEADRIADEKGHEKPEAPYNNYNQPGKGQKEEKGTPLAAKASKKDIVAEEKVLSTADSKEKPKDSIANKTSKPAKGTGKSLAVEDSEMNPEDSLANDTKTNLPNPIAEAADALADLEECDSLIYADSPKVGPESLANEAKKKVNEDELGDEIDAQANAADALDDLTSAEAPAPAPEPEIPTEEPAPVDDIPDGGEAPAPEPEVPAEEPPIDGETPAEPTGGEGKEPLSDEDKNEVKSLFAQAGEVLTGKEIDGSTQVELANQAIGSMPTKNLTHNEQLKIQQKIETSDGMGEEGEVSADAEAPAPEAPTPENGADVPGLEPGAGDAIDQQIAASGEELPEAEEVDGEESEEVEDIDTNGEESGCGECGPFASYASSRGYDDIKGAGGMELANLLSGYATAHGEGMNDGDFGNIIILLTPEVRDELMGYGHDDFLGAADAFAAENPVADEEKLSPGSFDIELPAEVEVGDEEVEEGMYDDVDMETVSQGIGTDADVQMGGVETHADSNHPIDDQPMGPSDSDLFGESVNLMETDSSIVKQFADQHGLVIKPIRYKSQGMPVKRKGFDLVDQQGNVQIMVEPADYNPDGIYGKDKWMVKDKTSNRGPFWIKSLRDLPKELGDFQPSTNTGWVSGSNFGESIDLTEEELNELGWSDFKNVGKGIGRAASQAGQKIGDKVGGAMNQVLSSIETKIDKTTNQIKMFGDEIYRNYQKGVANGVIDDITKMAEEMGNTIVKLNRAAMKAGEEPVKVRSLFLSMANDIDANRPVQLTKTRQQFEGEDQMGIEKPEQPPMNFVGPQNLGVSSPMAGLGENEIRVRNYIKNRLEEKAGKKQPSINEASKPEQLKKLDKMIDEQWELFQKTVKGKLNA